VILFTFLMVIAIILYSRSEQLDAFAKILTGCILMLAGFLTEFYLGRVDFMISDGFRYYNKPEEWIVDIDRALWGYMNYFVKYIDIGGDFFIKILNVPILMIALYLLRSVFYKIKNPFWFALACPSLLSLTVLNLRDVLIWVMAFTAIKFYFKKSAIGTTIFIFASVMLYMLRPFMLVTALMGVFLFDVIFIDKKLKISRASIAAKRIGVMMLFVISSVLVYPFVKDKMETYLYNGRWLLESGYADIARNKGVGDLVDSSNVPKALGFAVVRYVMTPQPDSIVRRLMEKELEASPYGVSSEILRFVNQVFYYVLLLYLALNVRNAVSTIYTLNSTQKAVLFWLFIFLPIYSFVHFGGSHQRLKLPFQLMVFLIASYVFLLKRESSMNEIVNA